MSEVVVLAEGPTEQRFVSDLLAPYMVERGVFLTPIILSKPGEKGGDVKFARAKNDIENHLKQRADTFLTLMVDYYGIRGDWPGYQESKRQTTHVEKAAVMNNATADEVGRLLPELWTERRFIPYVSMHETEALYFSDPSVIAEKLAVKQRDVEAILAECGSPEMINDNNLTAPSKRLMALSSQFKKTSTGLAIAQDIGIEKMRGACPLFDAWLSQIEQLD